MPILKPEAPQASIAALHASLSNRAGGAGVRKTAPSVALAPSSRQSLARPALSYPVYVLGLTDLASGGGLGKAKLATWRHEFINAEEVVSADVSSGRRPKFLQLNVNSKTHSVQHELQSIAAGEVFASRSYQLRLLQISALGLRALWLRTGSGSRNDLVVPLAPAPRELTANKHYTPKQFIAALRAAAESKLASDALDKGA